MERTYANVRTPSIYNRTPSRWAIIQRKLYNDSDRFKQKIFLGNLKRYVGDTMFFILEETKKLYYIFHHEGIVDLMLLE